MLHTNELVELASEFAAERQSNKKWIPKATWLKAISIAQHIPLKDVCRAINVSPAYFHKKMARLSHPEFSPDMTFIEISPPKPEPHTIVKVNVETPSGHRMTIEGATVSCIAPLLAEFLK